MYKYETHCHTSPVSRCGRASAADTVYFYRQLGYDGIFITNHFLDGNINHEARVLPYCDQIDYYFSDYEEGARIGSETGLKVFPGVELSYKGSLKKTFNSSEVIKYGILPRSLTIGYC